MDEIAWHRRETRRQTEKTNLVLELGSPPPTRQAQATIWDLPPYSPDLNPIEKMWSKVKTSLRKAKARDSVALYKAVGHAMGQVTYDDIRNWFASCGYSLI